MSQYDLKSLKLPKLYGKMLSIFAGVAANRFTRPLLLGSLLENGGIPKLRILKFEEEPTYFPLNIPEQHAKECTDLPMKLPKGPRTPVEKLPFATIRDFANAFRDGKTSPLEVADQVIRSIQASQKTQPAMNSISMSNDEEIRKQAQTSAELIKKGKPRSLLEGVPVVIKDEIDVIPYPTTVGTKFLGKNPAAKDARVVTRLREAGAMIVGKTNMHEIGIATNGENVHFGRIANPYDLSRDTGGSSNGSGAAVAAGLVPVAIGADGGGSIRVPASLCGVVGLKPTFARVSEAGAAPLCWSVAHIGPLAASAEDAALAYQIIAGPDEAEPLTLQQSPVTIEGWNDPDLKGIRLGIYDEWFNHADKEVVEANRKMVAEFEKAGAVVKSITLPELDAMRVAHAVTILSEMAACMENYPQNFKDFAPSTQLSLVIGQEMSSHDYIQAQRMRTRAMRIFSEVFQEVDAILTPTTALTAPVIPQAALSNGWSDLSTDTEMMRYVYSGNLTGLPAISFPVGYDSHNMPIGMQAMGRHWEENLLLRIAYNAEIRMERALPSTYYGPRDLIGK